MSGETTVGSIVGFLRLDIADFEAGIARAQASADKLDGKDVDVKVKADTAGAEAKLAGVGKATDRVDSSNTRLAKSSRESGKGMGALATAVITLGPALVPLAVASVGLAAGFGAMGTAGVLAIVGIREEMQTGSVMGLQYSAQINTLKGNLNQLGRTAAAGMLGPFQASVADLQTKMPALNSIIGEFSTITGKTAGALTTGLLAAFIALKPLMSDVSMYTLNLSQRFAALMSGPGVVSFGDYVRSVFPQVMADFESIVGAVVHLLASLAPLGLGTLGMLRTFSDLISAIPVDVLATLAQTAASVYLGFKSFGILSVGIRGVGAALEFMGVSAGSAAVGVRALTAAAGAVGVIVAVATFLFSANAESARSAQQATNDYTDALIRSNGAITANVRETAYKNLVDQGAIETARALGLNLSDVTNAALGNEAAGRRVASALIVMGENSKATGSDALVLRDRIDKVAGALGQSQSEFGVATQAQKDHAAAMADTATRAGALAAVQQRVSNAQKAQADATATATQKMHDENDAAGLLKQTLDALNGKSLSAADAQNAFDSALVNMGTHVTATGKKATFTTTSINDMSSASVALRGQLNGQVENLQRVVEANGGLANSTGKARAQMKTLRQQIIDNAVAHGVNRAAAAAYIDKILQIPKKVTTTAKMDATAATAGISALQAQINALHGKTITFAIQANLNALNTALSYASGKAYGTGTKHADGSVTGSQFTGQRFAGGGFAESHVAMIAVGGGSRLWNEPETGGEAYIPLARSKRARSAAIWEETGRKLGMGGQGSGPVELGPDTIRALVDGITSRPIMPDYAMFAASADRRLVPR